MRVALFATIAIVSLASVSANVCYFRILPLDWDNEAIMASDLFSTFLNIANNNDARTVNFDGSGGQFNTAVRTVSAKLSACVAAGNKIVLNFHASGNSKRFVRKLLPAMWIAARGSAEGVAVPLHNPPPRVIINVFSCKPDDFSAVATMKDYINEVATVARRDEFGQWLFGARGSAANVLLLTQHAADPNVDIAAVPACAPLLVYPAGMAVGWITNMLVVNTGDMEEARALIHNGFDIRAQDGTQHAHHTAKEACYNAYPNNAVNLIPARVTSACVISATYAVSSDAGDRVRYPAPVLAMNHFNDANMATRPSLLTLAQAFPDLVGHIRAVPSLAPPIGRKAAVSQLLTARNNPVPPGKVAMPGVLLSVRGRAADEEADVEIDENEEDEDANAEEAENEEDDA